MDNPIVYKYNAPLKSFKDMLNKSNISVIKMEAEFPNQKAFNIFKNEEHICHVLFTGRVDEWKIVFFSKNNLVAHIIMRGNIVELHRVTNLAENNEYIIEYGFMRGALGIIWGLNYWGYFR